MTRCRSGWQLGAGAAIASHLRRPRKVGHVRQLKPRGHEAAEASTSSCISLRKLIACIPLERSQGCTYERHA